MADLQTLSSPDPASVSSKKKKHNKKRKAIDASLSGESSAAAEDIDVAVDDSAAAAAKAIDVTVGDPTSASASKKKKKHNKKSKAVDASHSDETSAAAKGINVTVDASLASGSAAAAAAPVVGYFPTGYNPLAASGDSPSTRIFRNVKHPSWIDLVVRPPGRGPDFVGKSYAGEAAIPQLCNYALGVLDKASGTFKVVPIAGNKILRLEPYFEVQKPAHSQQSGVTSEAGSAVAIGEKKVQDLTSLYGAKKDKDTDKKWQSLNEQTNDPSAYMELDLGEPKTNADAGDNQASVIVRNIPPYDLTADTSEKAYLLDEIIPKNIRSHLLEILGHLESGEFPSKGYGKFVSNRVHKLENLQGEDKERLAWILSYITHLLTLMERNSSISRWRKKENEAKKAPAVPQAVYRKLLVMFVEEGSSSLSTEKHELLINYILVLTLFADDFKSDPADIGSDLKMTRQMLKPYYDQLGCKSKPSGAFQTSFMTLPAPLNFPKEVTRKRKRR